MTWLSEARETFTAGTLLLPRDEELARAMWDALKAAEALTNELRHAVHDDPPTDRAQNQLDAALAIVRNLMEANRE